MNDNVPVPFQQSSKEEKKIESSLDRRLQLNPAIKGDGAKVLRRTVSASSFFYTLFWLFHLVVNSFAF